MHKTVSALNQLDHVVEGEREQFFKVTESNKTISIPIF